jgi:serine/threonine protein kinase
MSLDVERERLALEHLENVLTWPPAEREQRLSEALTHDPALLKEVRELLKVAGSVNEALPTELPMAREEDTPPPEQLGAYRVKELLGQGGMGRVYRAERADGAFERSVAVKLMRKSRVPEVVAAQFARECRILAGLQHRHIAQLLDAGVTNDRHSYFVMELVNGRPITRYAAEENLSLRATLQLFLQVCSAVRFAHARLVVHADIKPNNIIVVNDGNAKLLDFGVARMLADVDGAAEPHLPIALTPEYASPARQRGETPTTADDVFSLGVLLRDLLERFPELPADLRAICDRARAPETNDRYTSVETLQADIERWLGSFPVSAYGMDWRYVSVKFVARHRMAVSAASVGVVLLAGALAALALLYSRAEHARASAEQRFSEMRSLSRFVLFDVYDRLESVPRALPLRRDLAEVAQGYLDRLARDPAAPPAVQLDLIEGLRRLAQVQASPGSPSVSNATLARRNLDRAEALAKYLPAKGLPPQERALILARLELARVRIETAFESDFDAAHRSLDRATTQLDAAEKATPGDPEVASVRAELAQERADAFHWQGKYAQSMKVAHDALMMVDPEKARTPADRTAAILRRAKLLDMYAEGFYYTDDMVSAEKAYREAMGLLRTAYEANPEDPRAVRRYARSEWALAEALLEMKQPAEAETLLKDSVVLTNELQLLEPHDRDLVRTTIVFETAHARALAALGRHAEALPLLQETVAGRKRLWDEDPTNWSAARDYAIGIASLAEGRAAAGQYNSACDAWAKSIATFDRIEKAGKGTQLDEDHTIRIVREEQAKHCR